MQRECRLFWVMLVFDICCLPPCAAAAAAGGALSIAYNGNPLNTMAKVKEQIMLYGGVITSMAMSFRTFSDFVANTTSADGVFAASEDLTRTFQGDVLMHAVFCYGWWDNVANAEDGYWLCKNR
jgi:hypothetical protein